MEKKINTCLVILILFITGCTEKDIKVTTQAKTSNIEYLYIIADYNNNPISMKIVINKFEYEDHEYIWFQHGRATSSVIHNPNCKYCKTNNHGK
jgi:hypothetical protein